MPEKIDPNPFVRKTEILISVYNSYGKSAKYTDNDERDLLNDSMKESVMYRSLRDWTINSRSEYEAISFEDFKCKITDNFFAKRGTQMSNVTAMDVDAAVAVAAASNQTKDRGTINEKRPQNRTYFWSKQLRYPIKDIYYQNISLRGI